MDAGGQNKKIKLNDTSVYEKIEKYKINKETEKFNH